MFLFHADMSYLFDVVIVFFFKQKTAYEMRISDWSSDVCSSDLGADRGGMIQKEASMATTPPFDIVFFGGTGDLALRKLIPSLYQADRTGALHKDGRIFALGRTAMGQEGYLELLEQRGKTRLGPEFDEVRKSHSQNSSP